MNMDELLALILGDSKRIADAIATGAGWEIWMQVELAILLRNDGLSVGREVHYPAPLENIRVDFLAGKDGVSYAMELKSESANTAGRAAGEPIMTAIEGDIAKVKSFTIGHKPPKRWVIGIAYSVNSKKKFREYAFAVGPAAIYGESNGVGVIVMDADQL